MKLRKSRAASSQAPIVPPQHHVISKPYNISGTNLNGTVFFEESRAFSNRMSDQFASEMDWSDFYLASNHGPYSITEQGFRDVVLSENVFKWTYNIFEELRVGTSHLYHSLCARGKPIYSGGEGRLTSTGKLYLGNYSGHYHPSTIPSSTGGRLRRENTVRQLFQTAIGNDYEIVIKPLTTQKDREDWNAFINKGRNEWADID